MFWSVPAHASSRPVPAHTPGMVRSLRMHPGRSSHSRPLSTARLGPPAADTHQLIWGTWGTFKHFNLHQSVSICFNPFQSVSICFNLFQSDLIGAQIVRWTLRSMMDSYIFQFLLSKINVNLFLTSGPIAFCRKSMMQYEAIWCNNLFSR